MSDGAGALSALSSDLAFSVSFSIASELLDAAKESGISEDELVVTVLSVSILAAALPASAKMMTAELRARCVRAVDAADKAAEKAADKAEGDANVRGLINFAHLIISIIHRIAVSTSVQLLASNVRAQAYLRSVRIASLLGVTIFFLFLDASSSFGSRAAAE
jgi:hypothetical protein